MYYNFEIFHLREKNIPVDSVEIKEPIHAFAWEPVGSTFAIIHGETSNIQVSFYGLKTGHKPVPLSERFFTYLVKNIYININILNNKLRTKVLFSDRDIQLLWLILICPL